MEREYKYLPHGKPIPEGWEATDSLENTHHGHHATLIKRNGVYNQKGKGNDEMLTPIHLYAQLSRIFQFDYDAACTSKNSLAIAGACFDKGIDGLTVSWQGQRVFCNPPFSKKSAWIEKAHNEVQHNGCHVCVMILPSNSMDSRAWHEFIEDKYFYEILKGRVSFLDPNTRKPKNGNNSGTVVVYFMKKLTAKEST